MWEPILHEICLSLNKNVTFSLKQQEFEERAYFASRWITTEVASAKQDDVKAGFMRLYQYCKGQNEGSRSKELVFLRCNIIRDSCSKSILYLNCLLGCFRRKCHHKDVACNNHHNRGRVGGRRCVGVFLHSPRHRPSKATWHNNQGGKHTCSNGLC